ncbi:SIMPL domain-containing protein [Pseudoalteromonas sp. SSDWG2]|uniref:SIMPL domain-containing protein n=1 Tax=Pseudoalteromonas sp. SSDWG2 TaxID=3139391 RepID=UPI003BA9F0BE
MNKLLFLAFAPFISITTLAQSLPDAAHIQVNGVGEVLATPDKVTLNVSVNEHGMDVIAVKKAADSKLMQMIKTLKEQGVDGQDIHASQLNIHSKQRYNRDTQRNEFDGYEVSRTINVILRDIDKYPYVLQTLVAQGANNVGQSVFGVSNYDELYAQARIKAFKDAKANALTYTQGFGAKLGKVYSINAIEHQRPTPYPSPRMRVMAAEADVATVADAYNVGDIKITASVNAVYLLEN